MQIFSQCSRDVEMKQPKAVNEAKNIAKRQQRAIAVERELWRSKIEREK